MPLIDCLIAMITILVILSCSKAHSKHTASPKCFPLSCRLHYNNHCVLRLYPHFHHHVFRCAWESVLSRMCHQGSLYNTIFTRISLSIGFQAFTISTLLLVIMLC